MLIFTKSEVQDPTSQSRY